MNGVHDNGGDLVYATIVHDVGQVVKTETPVEEVADTRLGVTNVGVTHRGEFPNLETMRSTTSSFIEVQIAARYSF